MAPDEITALFATATAAFPNIRGQPTDDDLTALRDVLYPLLLDIPYDMNGPDNLIGIIEPVALYTATWGQAFVPPPRPPAYPVTADDASAVVRARSEAQHACLIADYESWDAAKRAVSKCIREAIDEVYYRDLCHVRSFYTTGTCLQLMDHLTTNCGGLHPSELINLPTVMMKYYNDAEGIPEYINMLEEAQHKLARANLPMSDDQLLAIASTSILASGHFPRPTDEWEALLRAGKMWTAWKAHYRATHIARKRQMLTAGTSEGSAHAAMAVESAEDAITPETFARLDGYLDNLAAAATTEHTTLTQLVENNATLTASVTSLTASVAALTAAYTLLAAGKPPNPAAASSAPSTRTRTKPAVNGYCWMHGFRVKVGHDSATCKHKGEGHKDTATHANTMNGSNANKGWDA